MKRILELAAGLAASVALAACVALVSTSSKVAITPEVATAPHFSNRDRALIRDYYRNSKHGEARSGRVQYGVALTAAAEPLARELEERLTPLTASYVRARAGADVVLMDRNTRVVVDVIYAAGD